MSTLKTYIDRGMSVVRRSILYALLSFLVPFVAIVASAGPLTAYAAANAGKPKDVTLVVAFRSLNNPYHVLWVKGAQAFAKQVGLPHSLKVLNTGHDNQAQLGAIRSLVNSTPGKVVIAVDPNTSAISQAIVRTVQEHPNAYVVLFWNKPKSLKPWNGYSQWVSFVSFNGVSQGYKTAQVLFDHMGHKGGIIALQGILDNVPSKQRFQGLRKALKQDGQVKLLAEQPADWEQTKAYNVTQSLLAKYGSKVKGIWAANDSMALGALKAVKDAGMTGVPIVSASDATPQVLKIIKNGGGIFATTNPDGYFDGSVGLALGYFAAIGKLDVSKLSHEQRAFYAQAPLVTKKNVDKYIGTPSASNYAKYWSPTGVFGRMESAIQ